MSAIHRIPAKKAFKTLEMLKKHLPLSQLAVNKIMTSMIYDLDYSQVYTHSPESSLVAISNKHPVNNVDTMHIFWDPKEKVKDEDIHKILTHIKSESDKWNDALYLHHMNKVSMERVSDVLASPDLLGRDFPKKRFHQNFVALRSDSPNPIKLHENYFLSRLKEKDIAYALEKWYGTTVDPKNFVERFKKLPNCCAYEKANPENPPVSFVFNIQEGVLSGGFTHRDHRGNNVYSKLLEEVVKMNLKDGLTPNGAIDVINKEAAAGLLKESGISVKIIAEVLCDWYSSPNETLLAKANGF